MLASLNHDTQAEAVTRPKSANALRMLRQTHILALSILSTCFAFTVGLIIDPQSSVALGPMFLICAIALNSWYGGVGIGIISIVLSSLLVDFFWVTPHYNFRVDSSEIPWFFTFILSGLAGMLVSLQRKKIEDRIVFAKEELEVLVKERTKALETSMAEHQRAEEESRKAQEELARVMRLTTMGELAASIAHEINQPLAAITSNADACRRWLSRDQPDLDEARAAVERIILDCRRTANVVKTVRDIVTKSSPHMAPIDINLSIREGLLLVERETRKRHATLSLHLDETLPKVRADSVQIQQVVINLVVNALDAMEQTPEPDRVIVITSQIGDPGFVSIRIKDQGEGIQAQFASKIFDALFTTRRHGMGMGLAICRSIIEGHGGKLWAEPRSEKGTKMCFCLPIAKSAGGNPA